MNLVANAYPDTGLGVLPDLDLELSIHTPTEAPVWHSIASDLRVEDGFATKRGRNRETDQFQTGDMSVTLGNQGRKYDPLHSSSPLYGHVKPNRRMRLLARWPKGTGTTRVVFDGYADGFEQHYDPPNDATASLNAGDGFKVLAQADLPDGSPWDIEVAADDPVVWHKLGDFSSGGSMADSGPHSYEGAYTSGGTSATGLVAQSSDTAVDFDGADDYARCATSWDFNTALFPSISSPSATVEFWVKTSQSAPASGSPVFWLRSGPSNAIYCYLDSGGKLSAVTERSDAVINDGATHHVCLTYTSGTEALYVDGVVQSAGTLAGPAVSEVGIFLGGAPAITSGTFFDGTIDEVAIYDRPLSATRVLAHYSAGKAGASGAWGGDDTGTAVGRILDLAKFPTGDRDIDTGSSTVGPATVSGTALGYIQKLADTEQGQAYMGLDGSMSDAHTFNFVWRARHSKWTATRSKVSQVTLDETMYADVVIDYDELGIYNHATVTRSGGTAQTAENLDSRREHFRRSYSKSTLDASDTATFDHASWIVSHYSDAQFRVVALVIKPQRNPSTLFPIVLDYEIGTRVTVQLTPQQVGSQISRDVVIEGVEHTVQGGTWTTVWRLSEADTNVPWILDDTVYSVLDSTTIPAF